jgi:hypothetical protein
MQLCGINIPVMGNRLKDIMRREIKHKPSEKGR